MRAATLEPLESRALLTASIAAPVLVSPGSAAAPGPIVNTFAPTLTWDAVPGAIGYSVSFNDIETQTGYGFNTQHNSLAIPLGELQSGNHVHWQVAAQGGSQGTGFFTGPNSSPFYFQVSPSLGLAPPSVFGPGGQSSPGYSLSTYTPKFFWTAVAGATNYHFYLHNLTLNTTTSFTIASPATSFTFTGGTLKPSTQYSFWMTSSNATETSINGPTEYFFSPAQSLLPPTGQMPGYGFGPGPSESVTPGPLSWNAVYNATGYEITFSDLTSPATHMFTVAAPATSFSIPASDLSAGHNYAWSIQSLAGSTKSASSQTVYFQTTLAAPAIGGMGGPTAPGNPATSATPSIYWSAVTGATSYAVHLHDVTTSANATYTTTLPQFMLPPGALTFGDRYSVTVVASNSVQSSLASNTLYFTTAASAPVAGPPGSATSPGMAVAVGSTLNWAGAAFATGYQVHLHDVTSNVDQLFSVPSTQTYYAPTFNQEKIGDAYRWFVTATFPGSIAPLSSNTLYFTAEPLPFSIQGPGGFLPPGPVISTTTPGFYLVSPEPGADHYQIQINDLTSGKSYSYRYVPNPLSFTLPPGALATNHSFDWTGEAFAGATLLERTPLQYFKTPLLENPLAPTLGGPGSATGPGPLISRSQTLTFSLTDPSALSYLLTVIDLTTHVNSFYGVGRTPGTFALSGAMLKAGDAYAVYAVAVVNGQISDQSNVLYFHA